MIKDILKIHYSADYLAGRVRYSQLNEEYERRSPFNAPMHATIVALLQHMYAVLTHYVPRDRMKAIRECGLPIHAVVSSEDLLIHPTTSITLARYLNCDFSYLPGGHMSHVEHTDIVIERVVSIWDEGLSRKFPHYRKNPASNMTRTMSLSASKDLPLQSTGSPVMVPASLDWPAPEHMVIERLRHVLSRRMDRWSFLSLIARLRKPGRLIIAPAMVLPVVIIQLRKIVCLRKLSGKEKSVEFGLLLYIFFLIFVVQEVTRAEG